MGGMRTVTKGPIPTDTSTLSGPGARRGSRTTHNSVLRPSVLTLAALRAHSDPVPRPERPIKRALRLQLAPPTTPKSRPRPDTCVSQRREGEGGKGEGGRRAAGTACARDWLACYGVLSGRGWCGCFKRLLEAAPGSCATSWSARATLRCRLGGSSAAIGYRRLPLSVGAVCIPG